MLPSSGNLLPPEVLTRIVHETHHFPTVRALSVTSKTMSAIATPHLLRLALAQDRCRIQDPGCLVYGIQLQVGNPVEDPPRDDVQSEDASRKLPRRRVLTSSTSSRSSSLCPFPESWITHADRCEESLKATAMPVVLWAALQPPELALNFLAEIEHVDPAHLWAMFLVPSTPCHDHGAWPADFPIRHAMSNALHTAAQYGNTEVVRWLLDREHLAAYHRSVLWPHVGAVASPWVMKPIDIPAIQPCVCRSSHLKAFLAAGTLTDPDDLPWASALHIALAHNQVATAKLLVERGANWATEPYGARGITALRIVCANESIQFLDYLLDWTSSSHAREHSPPQVQDHNGLDVSDYLSVVAHGPKRRLLERRLKALEKRLSEYR
ncbi:hypothetical protein GCG54_00015254 [Colletotrichum gloeosporioides]|uniref:Uncharacterized protein n=1 Tax=Colletotrichum gloeosporioides TaxID=474922 RepID=A0A8H4C773_COLGL|nr:uncharacterized protein GCG54_00015254 [Colletotrichum gloeosporioides]KAF3798550.1 hypothetical protein GCG54_00015254 [Colletotrichum gloeosporioides]